MSYLKFKKKNKIYFDNPGYPEKTYINLFYNYYLMCLNLNYLNLKIIARIPDLYFELNKLIEYLNSLVKILNEIELIESSYIVIKDKKIFILLTLRTLSIDNSQMISNIYNYLVSPLNNLDILKISKLFKFKEVKKYFNYIVKFDMKDHYFNIYSKENIYLSDMYAIMLDCITSLSVFLKKTDVKQYLNKYFSIPSYFHKEINEYYLLFMWDIYFKINNYYLSVDDTLLFIYKKYEKSNYSYYKYNHSYYLVSDNALIAKELSNIFPLQLKNIDIVNKTSVFLNKSYELLSTYYWQLLPFLKFKKNIFEFKDGIYLLDKGLYINENEIIEKKMIIVSFLYINSSYDLISGKNIIYDLINKIKFFFRTDFFQNREKNIKYFFLQLGKIINNNSLFNNQLYVSKNRLYIIDYIQNIIEGIVKPSKYTQLIDEIAPFFIIIKLYELNYNNEDSFLESIDYYNHEAKINIKYGIYHPEITDYHKNAFFSFIVNLNVFYLTEIKN
jgi:hypothetical protein